MDAATVTISNRSPRRDIGVLALVSALFLSLPAATPAPSATVVVRTTRGAVAPVAAAAERLGASVLRRLEAVDEVVVHATRPALVRLAHTPGVTVITDDHALRMASIDWGNTSNSSFGDSSTTTSTNTTSDGTANVVTTATEIGTTDYYRGGFTGRGIDVALIDSGVTPVKGLDGGRVINGPDLSFESQSPNLRHLDTFGHGTHMAGIIAGRDIESAPATSFVGVAPQARVVNVKVADADGNTDVSQVIAAIDWVVQHRRDNGLNIRALNLSFGTDATQDPAVDPLAHAVEVAWRNGIVVLAAAGNLGNNSGRLTDPGNDPFVISVGSDDSQGTTAVSDDVVSDFSSSGDGVHNPTLVAPGRSIVSLRVPGSAIDTQYPAARVGDTLFRGSGTSQATAVMSGAAALVLQQHPSWTPDQVKALVASTATPIANTPGTLQGQGVVNLSAARNGSPGNARQLWTPSTGRGTLEGARGSVHLSRNNVDLTGEFDIFGASFDSSAEATASESGSSWSGGLWNGSTWSGSSWSGSSWSDVSWSSNAWTGEAWSSFDWSSSSWTGSSWSAGFWQGSSWSIMKRLLSAGWCTEAWS